MIRRTASIGLPSMVPVSAADEGLHWGDGIVFLSSGRAILPLAIWLSTATEELSLTLGPLLLALGLSMLLGGIGCKEQRFQPVVARVNGSAMTLAVLVAATLALAYELELFVGVVEWVTEGVGLSALFTGMVLSPLVGGAAEFLTAVGMARKNTMDLSVSIALSSTLLMALLVVPVLVLVGPLLGHSLDLSFDVFELVAVITALLVSNLVSLDGRCDWLEGVLLLATYMILAAGFFFPAG